jgi:hypothetical protein
MEPVVESVESLPNVESTRVLKPHTFGLTKVCSACAQPVAHWHIRHPRYGVEDVDICALCFIYGSGWLVRERVRRLDMVIKAISLKRGKVLEQESGPNGDKSWPPKLVKVEDADSVLGAIVLYDRYEGLQRRSEQ